MDPHTEPSGDALMKIKVYDLSVRCFNDIPCIANNEIDLVLCFQSHLDDL